MKINPFIFRGYDLRGIVEKDLNEEIVEAIGKAYGTFLARRGFNKAIVGRDARESSPQYSSAIIKGLNWAGIDVIDIGLNLIGTFYWSQYYFNCPTGVYVSASHNPKEYNGFKFAIDFSETLVGQDIQLLREMVQQDDFEKGSKVGTTMVKDIRQEYFSDILSRVKPIKPFTVVVDAGFSTAGQVAPDILRQAGCKVVEYNCKLDPTFPLGAPDPTDSHMAQRLSKEVLEAKADIGFGFDSDGDRLGVVDEKGTILWNDILVSLFAIEVLKEHPGATIMYNALCSKAVEEVILQHRGKPFMWRTGHSFLKKKNQEVGAAFIGELSGHFFFSADFYNHDDAIYASLRLLSYLTKNNISLSQAIKQLPSYISSSEIKVFCPDDRKVEIVKEISLKVEEDFKEARIIKDERVGDGVRVDFEDAMFVIRYSQNGPYLTVRFEAKTKERYEFLRKYILTLLESYKEIDWNSNINVNIKDLRQTKAN